MRSLIWAAAAALLLGFGPARAAPVDRAQLEAYVDGAVHQAMRSDHVAGVTVAVVDRQGVLLVKGYGIADTAPARAVDADTLFRVGSISKTPVWIALLQLVEQGKIRLDDPVNDHLPEALKIPDEGFRNPIRIRHLMTHSAGFEESALHGLFVADARKIEGLDSYLRTHRVHRVREPGTVAVYSNYGASLAGAIVAQVSGESWPDYAERHILRPLGMTEATYREPYPADLAKARGMASPMTRATEARLARGFTLEAGAFKRQPFEFVANLAPAGALSASARDMAAYAGALLDPARMAAAGVLRPETMAELQKPLFANTPELGSWRHGFMDFSAIRGRPGFGHGGDLLFEHSTLEVYPEAGLAIFVSVNTSSGIPLVQTLPGGILARWAGPAPEPPPRAADAQAWAAKVAGTYRSLRLPAHRTERGIMTLPQALPVSALPDGDVLIGAGPQAMRYRPVGAGVFAGVPGPGRIVFKEAGGRMRLYDGFSLAPADRITFFEGAGWIGGLGLAGVFLGLWGTLAGAWRLIRGRADPAGLVLDGLCLLWLAGGILFAAGAAPWLADPSAAVFGYPGALVPAALWIFLAAALATPAALVLAAGPLRPRTWSWWRWTKSGAALAVFAALAVTLWSWGLLGYSGF